MARQTARRQSERKPTAKGKAGRKTTAKGQAKPTAKAKAKPKPTAKAELKRKTATKGRATPKRTAKRAAPREPAPARKLYSTPVGEPEAEGRREPEPEGQSFTAPVLGATFGSMVIVVVVAILNTGLGRDLERHLAAPARTLIAGPVIILAIAVVVASLLALVPAYRRDSLRVAEVAGWLIPSWLVMCGMAVAAIAWALAHA